MSRQAIVLAGGLGLRLRSAVPDVPKILAPVAGRPFITYVLELLAGSGFARAILAVGYRHELVTAALGGAFRGLSLDYAIETTPLGTGGAVWHASAMIGGEDFFVLNGDTFVDAPFAAMEKAFAAPDVDVAMAVAQVADGGRFGRVDVDRDRVLGFREKAAGGAALVNAGVALLRGDLPSRFPRPDAFSLETDFFQRRLADLHIAAVPAASDFLDIGVPDDYARAAAVLERLRRAT